MSRGVLAARTDEITYAWLGAITKVERDGDAVYIYGKATDASLDNDEQIVDAQFAKRALADWFSTGANVRQMHSTNLPPAGKGVILESLPDGEWVKSKIVEPTAMKLTAEGVYQGYSVGISRPRIVRDSRARGGRIVDGKIVELSVVDRPANSSAKFTLAKAAKDGSFRFIGKSVLVPAKYALPREPISRYRKGEHVTVFATDSRGVEQPYEGIVTRTGINAVELDQDGFADMGGSVRLSSLDIVAAYKGSVPTITKDAERSTEVSVPNDVKKEAFPGAAPAFGSEDKAAAAGDCDKCGGSGEFESAKCEKCGGSGKAEIVEKGADLSAVLDDVNAVKEDIKDVENDLEDITGQKADGDDKDDDKDEDEDPGDGNDSGDDDDDDAGTGDGSAPAAPKGVRVEPRGQAWVVSKGETILGTHTSREAAEAHKAALKREKRANKAASKVLRKTAKADVKKRADDEDVPWLIRRAHDFTCGAYKTEDVTDFYPSIEKNGVTAAISQAARNAVYAALVTEVSQGTSPANIVSIGKALRGITDFLDAEQSGGDAAGALALAARGDLHEAFKAENRILGEDPSGATGIPKPSEAGITPGQYKRPYISAGHQREDASKTSASIPSVTHPVTASDFNRGPLTEGHQRYLTGKLADIHDGLADWRPELCRMSAMDANGHFGADRQPPNPFVSQLTNGSTNAPTSVTLTGPGGASFTYGSVPITGGPVAKALNSDDIVAAVNAVVAPLVSKITHLQEAYEALAAQPDPGKAPTRGIAGTQVLKVDKVAAANEAQHQAARGRKQARVEFLQSLARGGNSDARLAAQERLARMGVEVE